MRAGGNPRRPLPPSSRRRRSSPRARGSCGGRAPCGAARSSGRTPAAPLCGCTPAPRPRCPRTASPPGGEGGGVSWRAGGAGRLRYGRRGVGWERKPTCVYHQAPPTHTPTSLAPPLPSAHLEHDLLHLLVGRLELALEHHHDLARVVKRVLGVHQGDDEADGLEERGEHLGGGVCVCVCVCACVFVYASGCGCVCMTVCKTVSLDPPPPRTLPRRLRMPRHRGSSTSSKDSMPYGAAASASAASVSDVMVFTFWFSSCGAQRVGRGCAACG